MIAPWAAAFIGIPFRSGGRSRAGCDCWGVLWIVYREVFGVDLPSYGEEYDRADDAARVEALLGHHLPELPWRPVPRAALVAGDGLIFRFAGRPIHVGVAVGDDCFLHVLTRGTASCLERLTGAAWGHRLVGAYRYAR